jgi:hypothetical protein
MADARHRGTMLTRLRGLEMAHEIITHTHTHAYIHTHTHTHLQEAKKMADSRHRGTMLARLRGLEMAHEIIRACGGEPEPITWEDLERDFTYMDESPFEKAPGDR